MSYEELSDEQLKDIYANTKTIAVVGASTNPSKPAHSIPEYLQSQGFRIIPVNPGGGEILGEAVHTSLTEVTPEADVVDVFRPSEETPQVAKDAVAIGAKVLWLQEGIYSDEAFEIASEGGLVVVMDRCMGATHRGLGLTKQG